MKRMILKQLRAMGFELKKMEDIGYVFKHNGLNYVYMPDNEDKHFLRIAVPCLYEVTEENRMAVLVAVNETNLILKYSRMGIMYDNTVWAVYEHYLHATDNLDDLLDTILCVINVMVCIFRDKINEVSFHTNHSIKELN